MNNIKNNLVLYALIIINIILIINSNLAMKTIINTTKLFVFYIFPSMYPTMILSNMLILNNVSEILPKIIIVVFKKLFNFNKHLTALYIISMISASPTNAIIINNYLERKIIGKKQAEILLGTTTFINPLFIVGTVGRYVFSNTKVGFLILILLYTSSMIKLFICRKEFRLNEINNIHNNIDIIDCIKTSNRKAMESVILVFGLILLFNLLVFLLSTIIPPLNNYLFKSIVEITSGVIQIKFIKTNNYLKILICYLLLNFSGLCIQMQNISLIKEKKISYIKYLIFRII